MILRLSQKLCKKIKAITLSTLPLDENPLADWSSTLFVAGRRKYMLLSNTTSLYSTVFHAKGITNDKLFIKTAQDHLRELMEADGLLHVYVQHILPNSGTAQFAKAFSRSVTGTMNELIMAATHSLVNHDMSLHDVSHDLNNLLFSAIAVDSAKKCGKPRDVFQAMIVDQSN
jgi:hypothetical protein